MDIEGSPNWCNFFVQFIDYLANPAILVKNHSVIENFVKSWMPDLNKDPGWFFDIKLSLQELHKKRYDDKLENNKAQEPLGYDDK